MEELSVLGQMSFDLVEVGNVVKVEDEKMCHCPSSLCERGSCRAHLACGGWVLTRG